MIALTDFARRLSTGAGQRDTGQNIGTTPTHTILVELKGEATGVVDEQLLGPSSR